MIIGAGDLVDWVADRQLGIIAAWAAEFAGILDLSAPFAECLAEEYHDAMMRSMLVQGTERDFAKYVIDRKPIGLDPRRERELAERFYFSILKIAQAVSHRNSMDRTAKTFPYWRSSIVEDIRTPDGHRPYADIILHRDHSFWNRWFPPFDMDCRCVVIALTGRQFERREYKLTSDEELAERLSRLNGDWPEHFWPILDFRR